MVKIEGVKGNEDSSEDEIDLDGLESIISSEIDLVVRNGPSKMKSKKK
jgi:hypothetical protein